ncbi:PRA1 family protein A2 isoform X2 [Hevea brasiliensis]|uniref:PRA1 family protein A2 isoform X2 n=1 Tax=Hevea brasiliensis TaxID=3981 RepID=UPI0025D9EF65|nr:PRA1 family protein A2 isoform X2 [Hevea brasiliensis]
MPPRSVSEFFSKFTFPRSYPKWKSRLKCNLYYHRTNYFILIVLVPGVACLTRPTAILAAALTALSIAFLNDILQLLSVKRPVIRGRPSAKKSVYISVANLVECSSF